MRLTLVSASVDGLAVTGFLVGQTPGLAVGARAEVEALQSHQVSGEIAGGLDQLDRGRSEHAILGPRERHSGYAGSRDARPSA